MDKLRSVDRGDHGGPLYVAGRRADPELLRLAERIAGVMTGRAEQQQNGTP